MRLGLLDSPFVREQWPGLVPALDEREMRERLQSALLTGAPTRIERCRVDGATWLPAENRFHLLYRLTLRDEHGTEWATPVAGRLLADADACAVYRSARLEKLAARMAGRDEVAPFSAPVATVEDLDLAVSVFPVDGELPTLVDATDARHMTAVLREHLPSVHRCDVHLVQYRRRNRCLLRYELSSDTAGIELVFGKVHARAPGQLVHEVVHALRARSLDFRIPPPLAHRPELQLVLMQAIPGRRRVARLLKRRLRGDTETKSKLTLEEAITACAGIAATLHGSEIPLGATRTIDDDLAAIGSEVSSLRPLSPELADRLAPFRERIGRAAAATQPSRPRLAHGDFKESQVLFDGRSAGLVDFDTVCQAEPARDLGHFLAYLRLVVLKERDDGVAVATADDLDARFLEAYVAARGDRIEDETRLRDRALLHRSCALFHLAVKSWAKVKEDRLERALGILESSATS